MKRAIVTALVVLLSPVAASAGTYLGAGIGPEANVGANAGFIAGSGRSFRLLGGMKFGRLSGELSITSNGLALDARGSALPYSGYELGLAGKYSFPLGSNFEVFGKAGVQRTAFSSNDDPNYDVSGNGILVGAGFEYRLSVGPISAGSLWVDYTHHQASLSGAQYQVDGARVGMWMLGFTVGL
jgi:hypothetical protein